MESSFHNQLFHVQYVFFLLLFSFCCFVLFFIILSHFDYFKIHTYGLFSLFTFSKQGLIYESYLQYDVNCCWPVISWIYHTLQGGGRNLALCQACWWPEIDMYMFMMYNACIYWPQYTYREVSYFPFMPVISYCVIQQQCLVAF